MIEVTRLIEAEPAEVMEILSDGWTYAGWIVGASTIRAVDEGFPAPGTRVHHAFGVWPLVIADTTHVLEVEPDRRLKLEARGWPVGQATVEITLEPSGIRQTRVTMVEDASAGPGKLVPYPVRQAMLLPRNRETLRRLAYLAEGKARRAKPAG